MNKPTVVEVFNDDGSHSHWTLVTEAGVKVWSENPSECKANGYPVESLKNNIINALHKAELLHNKDYSKVWEIMESELNNQPNQEIEKLKAELSNSQDNVGAYKTLANHYFEENNKLKDALKKADVIINNAANMAESSILKNAILLSLSSLNLNELLKDEQPAN